MERFNAFNIGALLFDQVKAVTLGYRIPAVRSYCAGLIVTPLRLR